MTVSRMLKAICDRSLPPPSRTSGSTHLPSVGQPYSLKFKTPTESNERSHFRHRGQRRALHDVELWDGVPRLDAVVRTGTTPTNFSLGHQDVQPTRTI